MVVRQGQAQPLQVFYSFLIIIGILLLIGYTLETIKKYRNIKKYCGIIYPNSVFFLIFARVSLSLSLSAKTMPKLTWLQNWLTTVLNRSKTLPVEKSAGRVNLKQKQYLIKCINEMVKFFLRKIFFAKIKKIIYYQKKNFSLHNK